MNRRRITLVLIIIVLIVAGGGWCLNTMEKAMVKQDNPEKVARAAIMALEYKEVDMVTRYFTPLPGRSMNVRLAKLFGNFDNIAIDGLVVYCILNEGVEARVQAVYDMVVSNGEMMDTQHCNKMLKLVYTDEKWWVNEAF